MKTKFFGLLTAMLLSCAGWAAGQDSDAAPQSTETQIVDAGVDAPEEDGDGLQKILADVSGHVLEEGEGVQVVVYNTFHEREIDTKRIIIKRNGLVTVPLIGEVLLAGKTVEKARLEILQLLEKDYLVDPKVELNLINYAPKSCYVFGKVGRPGLIKFSAEEEFTLLDAVTKAGGLLPIGSAKNIMIQRTVDGVVTNIKGLDIEKMAQDIKVKPIKIEDGDRITVFEKWW